MKQRNIFFFCTIIIALTMPVFAEDLDLKSPSAILIDSLTGRVLYEKNAYTERAMASTTKIMTCIIALENSTLDEIVTISNKPPQIGGTKMGIVKGETIKMRDMLYGMMLPSGNDSAIAIAEHIGGGDVSRFVELMNQKVKELGLEHTHYVNPHGLDTKDHYTTAYDLAQIARYALKNDIFNEIVHTKYITVSTNKRTIDLANTNELLGNMPNADGIKTGYTGNANRCLVGSASKDNFRVISVVLGSETKNIRTSDSKKLLEYGLNNYVLTDIGNMQTIDTQIPIIGNHKDKIRIKNTNKKTLLPLKKGEIEKIKVVYNLPNAVTMPIEKGDYIGNAIYKIGDEIINEELFFSDITAVNKKYSDYYAILVNNLWNILLINY